MKSVVDNRTKEITVIGGGTAGWLSALFIQHLIPNSKVTVIESSDIGILGAGEGTTPHFINFLKEMNINVSDLFKYTKATVKNGIKFTNWNKDNKFYYHNFYDRFALSNSNAAILKILAEEDNLDSYQYSSLISNEDKVKFIKNHNNSIQPQGEYAVHFDASLLAKYLKQVGIERKINCIDSIVVGIKSDEDDFITDIKLQNGLLIKTDFVIDCSGFKRLVIGKHYQSKWIDYSKIIPNNRAIAFFIKNTSNRIPPYTESIATDHGWVWKIPVQDRFGCGFVFNSNLSSDELIKQEILKLFPEEDIEFGKTFNFDAGCYEKTWIKNCVAVGLASGFIEPLEATSLMLSIITLTHLSFSLPGLLYGKQSYIDKYNEIVSLRNKDILDFIYLHYLTKRKDNDYWIHYNNHTNIPDKLKSTLEQLKSFSSFNDYYSRTIGLFPDTFGLDSYIAVLSGLGLFNNEDLKLHFNSLQYKNTFEKEIIYGEELKQANFDLCEISMKHTEFIESLKNEN
jgi:tryptophan halogenase